MLCHLQVHWHTQTLQLIDYLYLVYMMPDIEHHDVTECVIDRAVQFTHPPWGKGGLAFWRLQSTTFILCLLGSFPLLSADSRRLLVQHVRTKRQVWLCTSQLTLLQVLSHCLVFERCVQVCAPSWAYRQGRALWRGPEFVHTT